MKKQFLAVTLCLSVVMTNNVYSMNDSSEEMPHASRVVRKLDEKDLSASHAFSHYRWSDLNPYNWSAETKVTAAGGLVLFTFTGLVIYQTANIISDRTANHPKRCNPEMSYNIGCDDTNNGIYLTPECSANDGQLQLILTDTIRNVTHTVCRYWGKTPCCEFPVDYIYDKESLLSVIFNK